jgi:hypothetical protein
MKHHTTYIDIQRLKQQPRHGRQANNDDLQKKLENPISIDIIKSAADLTTALAGIPTVVGDVITSFSKLNKGLAQSAGLSQLTTIVKNLGTEYKNVIAPALDLENRNKQLNTGFGITSKNAAKLSAKLLEISKNYGFTSTQAGKYAVNIKNMLPLLDQNATLLGQDLYKGMQKTQYILMENLGLTADQANIYTQYAAAQGGMNQTADSTMAAAKAVAEAMGDTNGDLGYFKMITSEIAGTSEDIQLQYGKIPGNLETAVIKSKKFGLSLDHLNAASKNMLNIESSIGEELEYQLLTGRRLVDDVSGKSLTNTFREAALRGDMTAQADAMNKIIEQEGETLENNLFAREQMSKLLGMDEKQLASAIQKKKILDKAAAKGITIDLDGSDALEQAAKAVEAGALSPEDFEKLKDASDTRTTEDYLDQILQVNEEQLFYNKLLNQEAIIAATRKGAVGAAPKFSADTMQKYLTDSMLETIGTGVIGTNIFNLAKNVADTKGKNLTTRVESKQDVVIPPGNGRIISGPFGAFDIDDRDMIMAGDPNKIGGDSRTNNTSTNMQQFAAAIVAAINNQTAQLKQDNLFAGGINAPYYG